MKLSEFIASWKHSFDPNRQPYVHAGDVEFLQDVKLKRYVCQSLDPEHLKELKAQQALHINLLPAPYTGDLEKAGVIILSLNPHLDRDAASGSYVEQINPDFRDRLLRNMRQDFDGVGFPLLTLDPDLDWTGGYRYWASNKKLGPWIKLVATQKFAGDPDAKRKSLHFLATKIATIELTAYASFEYDRRFSELPSSKIAKAFVHGWLKDQAVKRNKLIVVTRGVKVWGFEDGEKVDGCVVYPIRLARAAPMGPDSYAGSAIREQLGLN